MTPAGRARLARADPLVGRGRDGHRPHRRRRRHRLPDRPRAVHRRARHRRHRDPARPTAPSWRVAVHGGFVEVSDDQVSILSDVAELADRHRRRPGRRPPSTGPRAPRRARTRPTRRRGGRSAGPRSASTPRQHAVRRARAALTGQRPPSLRRRRSRTWAPLARTCAARPLGRPGLGGSSRLDESRPDARAGSAAPDALDHCRSARQDRPRSDAGLARLARRGVRAVARRPTSGVDAQRGGRSSRPCRQVRPASRALCSDLGSCRLLSVRHAEELEEPLGRAADRRPGRRLMTMGALDEDRVGDHGVDQLVVGRRRRGRARWNAALAWSRIIAFGDRRCPSSGHEAARGRPASALSFRYSMTCGVDVLLARGSPWASLDFEQRGLW